VSDGPASDGNPAPEPGGVFGNLPRSRPGTRSPRRDEAGRAAAGQSQPRRQQAAGQGQAESAPRAEPDPPAASEPSAPESGQTGGIEDLAWAGIAAAAEAATIGVRLASRAMEAVKDAGKRS
jgi:hypothetical protein